MEKIIYSSLTELAAEIEQGMVNLPKLVAALYHEIEQKNGALNAYVTLNREEAMADAEQLQNELEMGHYRGPLHGVPLSIKDNIETKGLLTTMGSPIYREHIPEQDADVVATLRAAGAIIIGKVNTHQFAYGATGDRSLFGPTYHSVDPTLFPGGSSNGSAVSVATYLGYGSLGTDTGGSVRIPSAFNGTVGMKPTYGTLSNRGVYPLAPSLDHVGPITRTVLDNALLLTVLAGHTISDSPYLATIAEPVDQLRVGIPNNRYFTPIDGAIQEHYQQVQRWLEEANVPLHSIVWPEPEAIRDDFWLTMCAEAYAIHHDHLEQYDDAYWDHEVKERILSGVDIKAGDYLAAQYRKREHYQPLFENLFTQVDLLFLPTTALLPRALEERYVINEEGERAPLRLYINKFTGLTNYLGLPSISLPVGQNAEGLPIGMQLVGAKGSEGKLYQMASFLEQRAKG